MGEFEGYRCECGEEWFDEATVDEIEKRTMELGIFGLAIKENVSVSGNSLIIRVPKKLAEFLKIEKGSRVYIKPEGKSGSPFQFMLMNENIQCSILYVDLHVHFKKLIGSPAIFSPIIASRSSTIFGFLIVYKV